MPVLCHRAKHCRREIHTLEQPWIRTVSTAAVLGSRRSRVPAHPGSREETKVLVVASLAINTLVLAIPLYINRVYVSVLPAQAGDSLMLLTGLLLLVILLDLILKTARAWLITLREAREEHSLRLQAVRALLTAPFAVARRKDLQELLDELHSPVRLRQRFAQQWLFRWVDLPFVLVYLVVLALIGGWLALVPLVLLPVFLPLARLAQRRQLDELRKLDERRNFRDSVLLSSLDGAETMKDLGIEAFLVRRLEPVQEALCDAELQLQRISGRLSHLGQAYSQWCTLLVVSFGAWMAMEDSLSIGALAACTLLGRQVTMPFSRYFSLAGQDRLFAHAESRLQALLELPQEPHLLQGAAPPPAAELRIGDWSIGSGEALFVQTLDPRAARRWLESLTLLGEPNPLPVLYAGRPVAECQRSALRQRLPLLRDDDELFRGSVLDNLTGFRSQQRGAPATALCDRHGLAAEITALPQGYATAVGDQAEYPLPSGLAFRLQVIAALLEEPAVLLLDLSARQPSADLLSWLLRLRSAVALLVCLPQWPDGCSPDGVRLAVLEGDRLREERR